MRRMNGDEGATAIIVALVLVVLLGISAIALDGGNLIWERRQLQNSADAAALSMAIDCAQGNCDAAAEDRARDIALKNDRRGAHLEDPIDVSEPNQVTVIARTGDQSGGPAEIDNWFAPLLGEGLRSSIVRATASAVWESAVLNPTDLTVPVTASVCDFSEQYDGGSVSPSDLDEIAGGLPTVEELEEAYGGSIPLESGQLVQLHGAATIDDDWEDACTVSPGFSSEGGGGAGDPNTMPGGFGFLQDDGSCGVEVLSENADGTFWAASKQGTNPSAADCIKNAVGSAVTIPIFIEVNRDDKEFLLYAPAAFYITAARVVGGGAPSNPPGFSCPEGGGPPGHEWCLQGHFVQKVEPGPGDPDGTSFGVDAVRLSR